MERRTRRSEDPYKALCLQLEHSRVHGRLDAMVIAIDNGLLLAEAGEPNLCEALGAVAPLMDRPIFDGQLPPPLRGQRIDVRAVSVEGETLFIAAAALAKRARLSSDVWFQRSVNGVRRILARAA